MLAEEEEQLENTKSCNCYIFIRAESLMDIEALQFITYSSVQLRHHRPMVITVRWRIGRWNATCIVNTACPQDQVPEVQLLLRWAQPEFVTPLILYYFFVVSKIYTVFMCDPHVGLWPPVEEAGEKTAGTAHLGFHFHSEELSALTRISGWNLPSEQCRPALPSLGQEVYS